jgi:hypothetical protein
LKITPLKQYSTPGYPIQDILAAHPELLRLVPKRWANTPLVLSALSMACLLLAACNRRPADERASVVKAANPTVQSQLSATRVAPIFHHGEGRGSCGCVTTAAPIFLSEEEARQVIIEEAATHGIHFENKKQVFTQVETENLAIDLRTRKPMIQKISIALDGTDPQRNLSFEFVSDKDLAVWDMGSRYSGTLGEIAIEPVAKGLQKGFSKTVTGQTVGVFYDPVSIYSFDKQSSFPASSTRKEAKEKSIHELQEQVKDFIAWLKTQGII